MRWPSRLMSAALVGLLAAGCARPLGERALAPGAAGWTRAGPLRHFTARDLFEYIDGEADFVIPFGFRRLTQAAYRQGDAESVVDVYDMGSPGGAFGLFRSRANVDAAPVAIGTEGVADEARVEFWEGACYVAVSVPPGKQPADVLPLARSVAGGLPPTGAWPGYLELLPTERRVARSEQYTPLSFLGQEALVRAVSARYELPEGEATAFACRYAAPGEAAAALVLFRAYLEKQAPVRPLAVGEGGAAGRDSVLGPMAVFRRGRFLGGMTGHVASQEAEALLAELDRRLLAE